MILHSVGVQQFDAVQSNKRLVAPRRQQLDLEQRPARMRGTEIVLVRVGVFLRVVVLLGVGEQLEESLRSHQRDELGVVEEVDSRSFPEIDPVFLGEREEADGLRANGC